jgi:hypothetical protein
MNKLNKHKVLKEDFVVSCRCNKEIDNMIKERMVKQSCDRSTAIREILQIVLDIKVLWD